MAQGQSTQSPPANRPVSFFTGASRVILTGNNNFNVGDIDALPDGARRDPIEFLLRYCAPDALVDSKERYEAPKCAPATRDKIQEEIVHWINSPDGLSAIFWIFGSAGAGKSAICQTIAEIFQRDGLLLGNFFFSRGAGSAGRSNGDRLIPTLIYQLSQALPETRSFIKRVIRQNPLIMSSRRAKQMSELYVASLNGSPVKNFFRRLNWGRRVRLVVIDGWDECHDPTVQCDLLRIIADSAKALHLPVRFLIASRPESHLEHTFLHDPSFRDVTLSTINLDADLDAYQSICTFLNTEFRSVQETHPLRESLPLSWPSEAVVRFLASKSSPQFVYAATVMRYIGDPYADEPPDTRLNTILTISDPGSYLGDCDHPLEDIDKLYRLIFNGVKPRHREQVWCLLGILHLASQQKYGVPTTSHQNFEHLLALKRGHLRPFLRPLASVLEIPNDALKPIRSLHASLFDFLLDPRRSGNLKLDLQPAYERLLKFHIDNIESCNYSENKESIDELTRCLLDRVESHHLDKVRSLLGILCLGAQKPHAVPTTSPQFFEHLFSLKQGHLHSMLRPLASIIFIPINTTSPLELIHPHLFDFLLDRHCSSNHLLDLQQAYGTLLQYHLDNIWSSDHSISSIDELTKRILVRVESHHRETVWCLLGILYIARQERYATPLACLKNFERSLGLEKGYLLPILRPLASVVDIPTEEQQSIQSLHPSLFDFLLDSRRSGDLFLNLNQSYRTLFEFHLSVEERQISVVQPMAAIVNLVTRMFDSDSEGALESITNQISCFQEALTLPSNGIEPCVQVATIDKLYTSISDAAVHHRHSGHAKLLENQFAFYRRKTLQDDLIKDVPNPFNTETPSIKHYICLNIIATNTTPLSRSSLILEREETRITRIPKMEFQSAALHYFAAIIAQDLLEMNPTYSPRLKADMDIVRELGQNLIKRPLEVSNGDLVLGCRKMVLQYFDPTRIPPDANSKCDVFKVWSDIPVQKYQASLDARMLQNSRT